MADDNDESSTLFNLSALMSLEEERIEDKEKVEQDRLAAADSAKENAEMARLRTEADARAAEDARVQAELQALQTSEDNRRQSIEASELRIRMEAEAAHRAEEERHHQAHAEELMHIAATQKKGIPVWGVAAILALILGGALGGYFGILKPYRDGVALQELAAEEQAARLAAVAAEAQAQAQAQRELAERAGAASRTIQEQIEEDRRLEEERRLARQNRTNSHSTRMTSTMMSTSRANDPLAAGNDPLQGL